MEIELKTQPQDWKSNMHNTIHDVSSRLYLHFKYTYLTLNLKFQTWKVELNGTTSR
jgi:hypothetical protein